MKKYLLTAKLIVISIFFCQAQLLPSIGLNHLPSDTDSICTIPIAQGSGSVPGFTAGAIVPEFKLFTVGGDSVLLSEALSQGKPVLLISSSYTCPVFRGKIPVINKVDSIYQGLLSVFIIYTVEAHPIIDVSPYSGNVWTTSANTSEGILFEQPKTYGERKAMVSNLLSNNYLRPPVLIDGPCNEWWLNYGTEPNSATLIQTNGTVFAFQQWFDKAPDNIFCEIDSLLSISSGQCNTFGNGGTFTLEGDTIDSASPGFYIAVNARLINQSLTENVVVNIQRQGTQMPATWLTALCTDICYPPTVNSAQVTIPPGVIQPFIFYFYTDTVPASGMAQVRFTNQANSSNQYNQRYYGSTITTDIDDFRKQENDWNFYTNPAEDLVYLNQKDQFDRARLVDLSGRIIFDVELKPFKQTQLSIGDYPKGIYFLELSGKKYKLIKLLH